MTSNYTTEQFMDMIDDYKGIIIKISGVYASGQQQRQDLRQDIILELWNSLKRFDGGCKISTWIYRIALNVSMNYHRKQKRISSFQGDLGDNELFGLISDSDNSPQLELLYSSIEQLNSINKAIVLLYLDGNTHEQISSIMGISKTNVGTRMSRAKEELKKIAYSKL
ncbi:MAG: RNA polymerase sigma factor [Mucinivorans sp.]